MKKTIGSRWKKAREHPVFTASILVLAIILFTMIVVIILGYQFNWDWTGLGPYTPSTKGGIFQRGRTLWDWLQLLIVPIVLTIGGFSFNQMQKDREQKAAEQRAEIEHAIALDNQREAAFQEYIDKIAELLLKEHLRESVEIGHSEVRRIARVRTFAILSRLDAIRKRSILQFLRESRLVDKDEPIIDLTGADLSQADLSEAELSGVDLHGAILYKTDLSQADLTETNLSGANLSGARLWEAKLHKANLSRTLLRKADIYKADLSGADLSGADLSGADLEGTNATMEQLEKVKLLEDATLPDGSKHPY